MKEYLPIGSVVLLKKGQKKLWFMDENRLWLKHERCLTM